MAEASPTPRSRISISIGTAAPVILSLALLTALALGIYVKIDFAVVLNTWARFDFVWLAAAIVFVSLNFAIVTLRYQKLIGWMAGTSPPFGGIYRITYLATFVSLGAPVAALGDVAKIAIIRLLVGLSVGDSVRSVIYDRTIGLLGIAAVGLCVLPGQWLAGIDSRLIALQSALLGGALLLVVLVLALCHHPALRNRQRLRFVFETARGFLSTLGRRARLLVQTALALAYMLIYTMVMWSLAAGMGLPVNVTTLAMFMPIVLLFNNLPFLYFGWGGREAAIIATIGMTGEISPSEAVALSVAYGLVYLAATLPGGILLLRTRWR